MSLLEEILRASKPTKISKELSELPFAEGFWPWVAVGRKHLKKKAGHLLDLLSPAAAQLFERSLVTRLVHLAAPSFALELSIARMQRSLNGRTGRQRYLDFLRKTFWSRQGLSTFFEEYSEIARTVPLLIELWVAQAAEFLERLSNDLPLLAKSYNRGMPLGKIIFLAAGEGDTHQEGRSVYRLKFASGRELFYKPKDLSFAVAFHALFDQLKAWGVTPDLKGYTLLARDGYGWEEKVEHAPCKNQGEVARYFERSGMLLALLYIFDGVDAHYENLIACGEHPILIDLETFFHRGLFFPDRQQADGIVAHSVLATTLLPVFVEKPDGVRADISGLSGQRFAYTKPEWKHLGTDELQLVYEKNFTAHTLHQVFLGGVLQEPRQFVKEIMRGFRKTYMCIAENRSFFLQKGGWLDQVASFPMRIVLRPTRLYSYLLERCISPTIALHREEREKELRLLSKYWLEPGREHLSVIIEEEKRALQMRDVPIFHTFPKKRDLYSGERLILKRCLDGDGYERVSKRISTLSEEDCILQETFIDLSFYGKETEMHEAEKGIDCAPCEVKKLSRKDLVEEAIAIGEKILKRAYRSKDGSLGWVALEPKPEFERYELQPLTDALYGGKVGVAFFFAALHFMTKDKKWRKAAQGALKNLRDQIAQGKAESSIIAAGIGGMTGAGGLIYGLCKIGVMLTEPALIEDARKMVIEIKEKQIQKDRAYDVIGGSAGLILGLLALWEVTQEERILHLAERAAEHLCASVQESRRGFSWPNANGVSLLGFSHGVAGIAYALSKISSHVKNPAILKTIKNALKFERSYFCTENKNWPRLHKDQEPLFMCSWCHGAIGVGFSRLCMHDRYRDKAFEEEIEIAIEKTLGSVHLPKKLGLCCGALGGLEFLRSVENKLPHLTQKAKLEEIAATLFAFYKKQALEENAQREVHHPGLLQGASGVGYTLLRLADTTNSLPQVLLLE